MHIHDIGLLVWTVCSLAPACAPGCVCVAASSLSSVFIIPGWHQEPQEAPRLPGEAVLEAGGGWHHSTNSTAGLATTTTTTQPMVTPDMWPGGRCHADITAITTCNALYHIRHVTTPWQPCQKRISVRISTTLKPGYKIKLEKSKQRSSLVGWN